MADGPFDAETGQRIPRDSTLQDVVRLCRELHSRSARFILVEGYPVRWNGINRSTNDIGLLIDTAPENERRVFDALATLPDGCVREKDRGDIYFLEQLFATQGKTPPEPSTRPSKPGVIRRAA